MERGGMRKLDAIFVIVASSLCLSGCEDSRVTIDQCANAKKLRVKVGNTLFDLPKYVITPGGEQKIESLGIVPVKHGSVPPRDPENLIYCNSKNHPVADFGAYMGFAYLGDGTEPKEYRQGQSSEMYALTEVSRYEPGKPPRSDYLADAKDIEKVRFVERRIEIPPASGPQIITASYEFAYQGKKMSMICQIWDQSEFSKNDPVPPFPYQCSGRIPFRAGDILIATDQRSYAGKGANARLIPPEEWPKQWAYTIKKILSFRVEPNKGASQ
jgi:hypothetical protein